MPTVRAERKGGMLLAMAFGMGAALVTTLVLVVLFALIIKMTDMSDSVITSVNQVIKVLAIMIGTFVMTRGGVRGYVAGLICGGLYMLLGIVVYCLLEGKILPALVMTGDVGLGLVTGGLCGLLAASLYRK